MSIKDKILFRRNLVIMIGLDAVMVLAAFYFAYLIRFEFAVPFWQMDTFAGAWYWVIVIKLVVFWLFGLYRGMWRYTSVVDLVNVLKAVVASSLLVVVFLLMFHRFQGYSRSVFILDALFTFTAVGGIRLIIRISYARAAGLHLFPSFLHRGDSRKLIIIGAGDAGEKVIREINGNASLKLEPVGILDDNPSLKGKSLHGVPVLGDTSLLINPPVRFDEVLIAMPAPRRDQIRTIVNLCEKAGKPFRTVPSIDEFINGKVSLKAIRNVRVEDLLGRDELHLNEEEIAQYLKGKRVMVTGAGGSIGSELVRQIMKFQPQAVGLFEISELNLFQIEMELRQHGENPAVQAFLADIRDRASVDRAFEVFRPNVVFHAAAYKHVPMQEAFPWEAVNNNIIGTRNLVEASIAAKIERFVLVSTDKAVRPTNVMGATKRVAELIVSCRNGTGPVRFMAVRFGNVMGSSGSAIPIFREQINRGGPVTVTHPDVTRFFMSVGEAAQLILQAGAIGHGGEIFILDMGNPIRILDLVKDMIRLHGFEPDTEIPIRFTGLRPGEKLYEELITEGEGIVSTGREKIMVLKGHVCPLKELEPRLKELLRSAADYDAEAIRARLKTMVPEYRPKDE